MRNDEITRFIDCMTYEDCTVRWNGKTFWCLGMTHDKDAKTCGIGVWECNPKTFEFTDCLLDVSGTSVDECMKHFLEDRYWNGKTFYDIANELEWIDL